MAEITFSLIFFFSTFWTGLCVRTESKSRLLCCSMCSYELSWHTVYGICVAVNGTHKTAIATYVTFMSGTIMIRMVPRLAVVFTNLSQLALCWCPRPSSQSAAVTMTTRYRMVCKDDKNTSKPEHFWKVQTNIMQPIGYFVKWICSLTYSHHHCQPIYMFQDTIHLCSGYSGFSVGYKSLYMTMWQKYVLTILHCLYHPKGWKFTLPTSTQGLYGYMKTVIGLSVQTGSKLTEYWSGITAKVFM